MLRLQKEDFVSNRLNQSQEICKKIMLTFLLLKQKADTLITALLWGNKQSAPFIYDISTHVSWFYHCYAAESSIVHLDDIISAI